MVLVALAILYFFPAYYFPLIDMDEGAYAAVSREMVLNGSLFTTILNGEPFFHKPALMYWTQSLGVLVFGDIRFSFRLPSLIAFSAWLYVSYHFVKKQFDIETAWLFTWISIFAIGSLVSFKAAIPDAWLILFISLGIYKSIDFVQNDDLKALTLAFMWTGFGILTKGPIAFVVVAGTLFIYLVTQKNGQQILKAILHWKGWLLMLIVVLPWYLSQVYFFGQQFLDEFFGTHNVGRFLSPMEEHDGSPFFYVFDLIALTLPFLPILVAAMIPWLKDSKQTETGPSRFLLIWFLLVFIFFTIAATKLPHYLMYGMPPVLIMMAYALRHRQLGWGIGATLVAYGALLLAIPEIIKAVAANEKNQYFIDTLENAALALPELYYPLAFLTVVTGVFLIIVHTEKQLKLLLAGFVSALSFTFGLFAFAVNLHQDPIVNAAHYVKNNDLKVITCCIEMPSFNVEAQQVTPIRQPENGEIVFGERNKIATRFQQVEWLYVERGVAVAKVIHK